MKVSTAFDYSKISNGKENEIHLMVTMTAPIVEIEEQKREPLEICAALDNSGSMSGQKIEIMKKSACKFIDNLSSRDRISVIAFSTNIVELTPEPLCATAENKEMLKKKINELQATSSTNMSGALESGFAMLGKVNSKTRTIKRVILFTDGQPTTPGKTKFEDFMEIVQNRDPSISISTFGYGNDHDGELLGSIARIAKGNMFYVQDMKDCPEYFGTELGGMLLTYARDIKLRLTPNNGVSITKVLNNFSVSIVEQDGKEKDISTVPERIQVLLDDPIKNQIVVKPDDLFSEESRKILIQLKIPAGASDGNIVDIALDFEDVLTRSRVSIPLNASVDFVSEPNVQTTADSTVEEQVLILNSAQVQHQARIMADRGDYSSAQKILSDFGVTMESAKSYGESVMLQGLRGGMADFSCAVGNYDDSVRNNLSYSSAGITRGRSFSKGLTASTLFAKSATLDSYVGANFLAPDTVEKKDDEVK